MVRLPPRSRLRLVIRRPRVPGGGVPWSRFPIPAPQEILILETEGLSACYSRNQCPDRYWWPRPKCQRSLPAGTRGVRSPSTRHSTPTLSPFALVDHAIDSISHDGERTRRSGGGIVTRKSAVRRPSGRFQVAAPRSISKVIEVGSLEELCEVDRHAVQQGASVSVGIKALVVSRRDGGGAVEDAGHRQDNDARIATAMRISARVNADFAAFCHGSDQAEIRRNILQSPLPWPDRLGRGPSQF